MQRYDSINAIAGCLLLGVFCGTGVFAEEQTTKAQTINQRGVTIVPLDVKVLEDGEIYIRALDPAYANPGPDEVQQFAK